MIPLQGGGPGWGLGQGFDPGFGTKTCMPCSMATFSYKQKLGEFITTTPGQKEMVKGVLQGKMK